MPNSRSDRELSKFLQTPQGETATRIAELPVEFGELDNLSEVAESTLVVDNDSGFNTIGFYCSPPTSGIITFETTYDGIHWETTSIRGITSDTITSVISTAGNFIGSIAGNRAFRFRTSTGGSAPGTVMGRQQRNTSVIETIEFGYPPHKVGFPTERHSGEYTDAETNTVLWQPTSGKAVVVTDLFVFARGSTDALVTVFIDTNVNGNRIFNNDVSVAVIGPFTWSHQFKLGIVGAVDEAVKVTTSAGIDVDIMAHGYEI